MKKKIGVAILGCTGPVGQKAITLLSDNPEFYVAELAASAIKQNHCYGEVVQWKNEFPLQTNIAELPLLNLNEIKSHYIISALPAAIAYEVEPILAKKGHLIFSNASAFRMSQNIPLLIPEINSEHLELLKNQNTPGKIVTNPNCSTVFLALALAPLSELAPIEKVSVVTLQAASGAGYPGVPSFDLLGNTIPFISGEEEKIENETRKILGLPGKIASFEVLAHVNRVPVLHGHSMSIHIHFKNSIDPKEAVFAFEKWNNTYPGLYEVHSQEDRPQPARDLTPHDSRVHIGRIKQGSNPRLLGLVSMGHNLVRGAAGAAIANMSTYLRRLSNCL